jgi:hypothetical protein
MDQSGWLVAKKKKKNLELGRHGQSSSYNHEEVPRKSAWKTKEKCVPASHWVGVIFKGFNSLQRNCPKQRNIKNC